MSEQNSLLQALQSIKPTVVPVEVLGQTFYVRGMTGAERAEYVKRKAAGDRGDRPPVADADVVALTLTDAEGNRLIPSGDASSIAGVHGGALKRLAIAALNASILTDDAEEDVAKK